MKHLAIKIKISYLTAYRDCLKVKKMQKSENKSKFDQMVRLFTLEKTLNKKMSGGKKFIF